MEHWRYLVGGLIKPPSELGAWIHVNTGVGQAVGGQILALVETHQFSDGLAACGDSPLERKPQRDA